MELVYDYVWFVIGATALITFILAWIIRGILSTGRRRRAVVERDVALTELEQVRAELDSLYAAQRRQRESQAETQPGYLEELRQRDERLAVMAQDLEAAQTQLEQAREEARAVPAEPEPDPRLEEAEARNAWLEERVHELEGMVHTLGKKAEAAEARAVPEAAPEPQPEKAADPDADKRAWQVGYLQTRVETLEQKLIEAEESEPEVQAEPAAAEAPAAVDEELARLRWRNRYLEGRLAYYEEMPEAAPAEEKSEPATASAAPVPVTPAASAMEGGDGDTSEVAASHPEPAETEADAGLSYENDDAEHPAEKMLRALEAEDQDAAAEDAPDDGPAIEPAEPRRLDKPQGAPDDLTLISGIGPRIQTILNELGIWHFSQIAAWTPSNEAWIDQHLNFAGRVSREGWIGQAGEFISANAGA